MCLERVEAGMLPMCVKVCITGAMNFGERDKMLALAKQRLSVVQKEFPDAALVDEESVRVIYLINHKPELFQMTTVAKGKNSFDNIVLA